VAISRESRSRARPAMRRPTPRRAMRSAWRRRVTEVTSALSELRRVAHPRDRPNQGRVASELRAKAAHVDVHRARLAEVPHATHLVEELLAGEDATGALQEILQEAVLRRGELERAATEEHLVAFAVDLEGTDFLGLGALVAATPPEDRPDARD